MSFPSPIAAVVVIGESMSFTFTAAVAVVVICESMSFPSPIAAVVVIGESMPFTFTAAAATVVVATPAAVAEAAAAAAGATAQVCTPASAASAKRGAGLTWFTGARGHCGQRQHEQLTPGTCTGGAMVRDSVTCRPCALSVLCRP
jgi:hypothetical protein